MTGNNIYNAIVEAKKFISMANIALSPNADHESHIERSVETGALRRQSIELTRALAIMRKP